VPPYERGFPMVFQSFALFPHMSVAANVAYGLRVRGVTRVDAQQRVARALSLLRLESERDKHPAQLSGGQQQRAALARCLVLEPDVILLDEPLSSLDAELRVSMRREIRALQQTLGITAIHVTHDQEEALSIADRVVVMRNGRVEQDGTPEDIYQRPRTEFVARFMGSPNVLAFERDGTGGVRILDMTFAVKPPSEARQVLIRPDAIQLRTDGPYRGRIVERTYLGGRIEYVLEVSENTRLMAECPAGSMQYAAGDIVSFDVIAGRLHFL
jgi:putative spermidine/putrescine transport system ATP-binding protein